MAAITLIEAITQGEPEALARCVEAHLAPVSDQPWMAGPELRTMDGFSRHNYNGAL